MLAQIEYAVHACIRQMHLEGGVVPSYHTSSYACSTTLVIVTCYKRSELMLVCFTTGVPSAIQHMPHHGTGERASRQGRACPSTVVGCGLCD